MLRDGGRDGEREGRKRKIYEERIYIRRIVYIIILIASSLPFPFSQSSYSPTPSLSPSFFFYILSSYISTPLLFFLLLYHLIMKLFFSFQFLLFPLLLLYRLIILLFYSVYYLFLFFLFLCTNLDLPIRINPFSKHVPNNRLTRRPDNQRLLSERQRTFEDEK